MPPDACRGQPPPPDGREPRLAPNQVGRGEASSVKDGEHGQANGGDALRAHGEAHGSGRRGERTAAKIRRDSAAAGLREGGFWSKPPARAVSPPAVVLVLGGQARHEEAVRQDHGGGVEQRGNGEEDGEDVVLWLFPSRVANVGPIKAAWRGEDGKGGAVTGGGDWR